MIAAQKTRALDAWRWRRARAEALAVQMADALVTGRGIGERLIEEYAVARAAELMALNAARAAMREGAR